MNRTRALAAVPVVSALLLGSTAAAPPESGPASTEHVEVRLVQVPVRLEAKRPGACADVGPEQIELSEDGAAVDVRYLEPKRMATTHAILVDAGPEMLGKLPAAREAALAYLRSVPPNEPALLATFDHRLILAAPPSFDRERLERRVGWIEPGAGSHLWDASLRLVDYLAERPERKALILVTRGCDSLLASDATGAELLRRAAADSGMIVFVIGLDVPVRCELSGEDPQPVLRALARDAGGTAHFVDSAAKLPEVFRAVQERLASEAYLVYAPPPFGAGPKDRPAKERARLRSLRVRLRGRPGCELSIAGPPSRCEAAAGTGGCSAPPRAVGSFRLEGDGLRGRIRDIVVDRGPESSAFDWFAPPRPERRAEQRRERDVAIVLPPLADLVSDAAGPLDFVGRQLEREASRKAAAPTGGDWSAEPFLINGLSLLELHDALAEALVARPEYRAWATALAREERLRLVESLVRASGGRIDQAWLDRAAQILSADAWEPEPQELSRHLGVWLGDVHASQVFHEAEAWLGSRLQAAFAKGGDAGLEQSWADAQALWPRVAAWVPSTDAVHVLGWLVPAYDPAQRAIGFRRVILGQPHSAEVRNSLLASDAGTFLGLTREADAAADPDSLYAYMVAYNYSRETPLGVRLVRWMLRQPGVAAALADLDVVDVQYPHAEARDLWPSLREYGDKEALRHLPPRTAAYPARAVNVTLRERGSDRRVSFGGYFALPDTPRLEPLDTPLCLVLGDSPGAAGPRLKLLAALAAAETSSPFPCLMH